ncbi:hypothetical protein, partial [Anaerofustis stercorihominis]|uniref:hypothetical protein n=1 Tax=Anaerofustis stercorihominis TaxID=214853 RepID=UPI00148530D0
DQRSAVNTKNNSLYQAYPGYGSRGTSVGYFRKNVEHKEKNMDNYVYEHNSIPGQPTSKDFTKKYLKIEPTTKNTTKVQKTANVGDFRQNVDNKPNKEKAYGYEHISIPGQPTSKDFTKKYLKVEPTTKNTTKVQKTANVGDFRQNVDSKSNKEKAYGYEHISIPGQPTSRNFTQEHLKAKSKSKNTKLQNPVNTSDIMNYYYVPNGKFNKDEFNQKMNEYNKNLSIKKKDDVGTFRQDIDSSSDKRVNYVNEYPVYGSKMSINDVNALNKKYDGFVKVTEDEANQFKKVRAQSYKSKSFFDKLKRFKYEVSHNGTPWDVAFNDVFNNKDMNDNKNDVDSASDDEKIKQVNDMIKMYGGTNLEDNVRKNGGENLDFENALAISTNPAFKNQDLTKIENMDEKERKLTFVIARELGQEEADKFMDNLSPKILKRESDLIKDLSSDSLGTLYGLATLSDKNDRIDGLIQLSSLLHRDTSYKEETPLHYAITDIAENGTPKQQNTITAANIQNDLIALALLKGDKFYIDIANDLGNGYKQQMYNDEHSGK